MPTILSLRIKRMFLVVVKLGNNNTKKSSNNIGGYHMNTRERQHITTHEPYQNMRADHIKKSRI
jgi:hypothetical protein